MTATSPTTSATDAYRTSRDQLLELRGEHERAVREFRFPDLGERWNWGIDWFDAVARGSDRACLTIVQEDESSSSVSFDEMAHRSDQVAALLASLGVRRGDAVVLMLGNQVELWESMLAVIKLGAVVMPTTTAVGPGDLVDRMERGGARAVITNAGEVRKFDDVPGDYVRVAVSGPAGDTAGEDLSGWADYAAHRTREARPTEHPGTGPEDRMLLYFTSGTTSRPKLVEHTQASYPAGHLSTMYWLGLRPGDVHLNISSPGWAKHAWSSFFAPWAAEATILVHNYARFDPAALLRVLTTHDVTSMCAPPTVWRMLIKSDLSGGSGSLREVIGAGEPLNPEVIAQVEKAWGLTIRDGYGQTEMTAAVGNTPGSTVKPGSMGRPLPGCPVVLVDPVTNVLAPQDESSRRREGEICLDLAQHPVPLMTGYQGDEERNAAAMEGGWYHTGDVASMDAEGYITYIGRTDDVFKASDYKISPFELESVLIEHPAVAEAAVVPAPDPVRLAVPKAYIALAPGVEPGEDVARSILAHAREKLPAWQRVRRIEFFELPKTISGKIRRVELRGRENDLDAAGGDRPELEWRDDQFPELRGVSLEHRPDRIILVRHGESEGNVDDSIYERVPDHRIGLTPKGVEQARVTGEAIRGVLGGAPIEVYVSPYVRARQTLGALSLPVAEGDVRVEPRLREQDWANFQDPADIAAQKELRNRYGHFYYRFTHGESGSDVYDRVSTFLESMHRTFLTPSAPRTIVIVTHGLTMRLFCMRWFHWSVEYFESLDNPGNGQPVVLRRQPDFRYRLEKPFTQWDASVTPTERERSSWL